MNFLGTQVIEKLNYLIVKNAVLEPYFRIRKKREQWTKKVSTEKIIEPHYIGTNELIYRTYC